MGQIDGVPYSHNIATGIVVVGSGLVSNNKRDTFKLKAEGTLEAQLRSRPKFMELAAAVTVDHSGGIEAEAEPATDTAMQPQAQQPTMQQQAMQHQQVAAQQPVAKQPMAQQRIGPHDEPTAQQAAQAAVAKRPVLFGGSRRQAVPVSCGEHGAFRPALLESDLGVAWELGRGNSAEAEREKASKAAVAQYEEKQRAAIVARKESAKRNREEQPCVCEVEALRETVQLQRQIIRANEKVAGPIMRWLHKAAAQGPQADDS